jgi:Bacterial PH domain
MPAASEVSLPHSFRPYGVRIAIYALGAVLVLAVAGIWLAFPQEIRDQFTFFQRATVVGLGLMFYAGGYALARSRLVATEGGLTVMNGYRTRRFEWNEILAVTLRPGGPWAELDIADGTTVPAMGIQGSDGARARAQVRQLRALVQSLTR